MAIARWVGRSGVRTEPALEPGLVARLRWNADRISAVADLKKAILARAEKERVKFIRLQFTDILGVIKNVEVPDRQFDDALDGRIMFDGSSIEGFVRIEESDMYLKPDLATFRSFPGPNRAAHAGPAARASAASSATSPIPTGRRLPAVRGRR